MGTLPGEMDPEIPIEEGESAAEEVSVRRIQILNLGLLAAAALASLLVSRRFALGVIVGGLLMAANFGVIVGVVRSIFASEATTSILSVGIYWVKFAAVMVLVGVIILVFRVDAIGFLIGLSTILVAITAEAVLRLMGK